MRPIRKAQSGFVAAMTHTRESPAERGFLLSIVPLFRRHAECAQRAVRPTTHGADIALRQTKPDAGTYVPPCPPPP